MAFEYCEASLDRSGSSQALKMGFGRRLPEARWHMMCSAVASRCVIGYTPCVWQLRLPPRPLSLQMELWCIFGQSCRRLRISNACVLWVGIASRPWHAPTVTLQDEDVQQ